MVPFTPGRPLFVIVQFPKTSEHLLHQVTTPPLNDGDFRVLCLVADLSADPMEEQRFAHLLGQDEQYSYGYALAEVNVRTLLPFLLINWEVSLQSCLYRLRYRTKTVFRWFL